MRLRCLNCVGVDWDEEEALPKPLQCESFESKRKRTFSKGLARGLASAHVQFKVPTNAGSLLNPPPGFTVAWTVTEEVPVSFWALLLRFTIRASSQKDSTFVISFCEVPDGLCQEAGRALSTSTNATVPVSSFSCRSSS